MMEYDILGLSPLPSKYLLDHASPRDGFSVALSNYCKRKLKQGTTCADFYKKLAATPEVENKFVQCPFGLTTYIFKAGGKPLAMTGFVPFPRMGGDHEKEAVVENQVAPAKSPNGSNNQITIAREAVRGFASSLMMAEQSRFDSVVEQFKSTPSALHEARKYNRTIKQEAERMCRSQNPENPDQAQEGLVRIWKASELLTYQFEVLDIIANETFLSLGLKTKSEIYKAIDKCVRIYRYEALSRKIYIEIKGVGTKPQCLICDKTFTIIPTVLLENAIKYSVPNSTIHVDLEVRGDDLGIKISNVSSRPPPTINVFEKGARGIDDGTGLGIGLFLAQMVAKQHGARIGLETKSSGPNYLYAFQFTLPLV